MFRTQCMLKECPPRGSSGTLQGLGLAYSHHTAPVMGLGTHMEVPDKWDWDESGIILLTNSRVSNCFL